MHKPAQLQQGFLLTRHWRDTADGTALDFWLATDDGPYHVRLLIQTAVAFIPVSQREQAEAILHGEPAHALRALDLRVNWNVVQFDLRILQRHADRLQTQFRFGRDGSAIEWREHGSGQHSFAAAAGRLIIDGIDALRSATWNFASFWPRQFPRSRCLPS